MHKEASSGFHDVLLENRSRSTLRVEVSAQCNDSDQSGENMWLRQQGKGFVQVIVFIDNLNNMFYAVTTIHWRDFLQVADPQQRANVSFCEWLTTNYMKK